MANIGKKSILQFFYIFFAKVLHSSKILPSIASLNRDKMAQLIKHYPEQQLSKIILDGDLETLKSHLDKIESQIASQQLSKCGTVFVEFSRFDDFTLNTCIYKNVDTDDQQTIDINFCIFP